MSIVKQSWSRQVPLTVEAVRTEYAAEPSCVVRPNSYRAATHHTGIARDRVLIVPSGICTIRTASGTVTLRSGELATIPQGSYEFFTDGPVELVSVFRTTAAPVTGEPDRSRAESSPRSAPLRPGYATP